MEKGSVPGHLYFPGAGNLRAAEQRGTVRLWRSLRRHRRNLLPVYVHRQLKEPLTKALKKQENIGKGR